MKRYLYEKRYTYMKNTYINNAGKSFFKLTTIDKSIAPEINGEGVYRLIYCHFSRAPPQFRNILTTNYDHNI